MASLSAFPSLAIEVGQPEWDLSDATATGDITCAPAREVVAWRPMSTNERIEKLRVFQDGFDRIETADEVSGHARLMSYLDSQERLHVWSGTSQEGVPSWLPGEKTWMRGRVFEVARSYLKVPSMLEVANETISGADLLDRQNLDAQLVLWQAIKARELQAKSGTAGNELDAANNEMREAFTALTSMADESGWINNVDVWDAVSEYRLLAHPRIDTDKQLLRSAFYKMFDALWEYVKADARVEADTFLRRHLDEAKRVKKAQERHASDERRYPNEPVLDYDAPDWKVIYDEHVGPLGITVSIGGNLHIVEVRLRFPPSGPGWAHEATYSSDLAIGNLDGLVRNVVADIDRWLRITYANAPIVIKDAVLNLIKGIDVEDGLHKGEHVWIADVQV